jgi:hypothetical protein
MFGVSFKFQMVNAQRYCERMQILARLAERQQEQVIERERQEAGA